MAECPMGGWRPQQTATSPPGAVPEGSGQGKCWSFDSSLRRPPLVPHLGMYS